MLVKWPNKNHKTDFFFNFSISKCYNIQINTTRQSSKQHLFHIYIYIYKCIYVGATCFGPVGHAGALQENSWICFLGGPEDDPLGRNLSP